MSREVPEWIAKHDDEAVPARVKLRIFTKFNGQCAHCTLLIVGSLRPAYDHTIALINGGENREENITLLCVPCHAVKTKSDVVEKAVTARIRAKHIGLKKKRTITRWRKFNGEIVTASRERT